MRYLLFANLKAWRLALVAIIQKWRRNGLPQGVTWIPYQNDAAMVFNTIMPVVPELMKIGGRKG